ncbi:hypothetical protein FOZ62_005399, partial [Perkinsus olseni]
SRRLTTTLARRFSRVTYVSAYLVVLLLFLGGLPYIGPTILAALLIDYAVRKFGYSTRQPVHVSLQTKANLRCIAAVMIIAGVAFLIFISIPIGVVVALTGALLEDALAGHREITSMNEGPVLLPSMVGRRFLQESDNVADPEDAPAVCYHNTEACEGGFSSGSCCAICLGSEATPQILLGVEEENCCPVSALSCEVIDATAGRLTSPSLDVVRMYLDVSISTPYVHPVDDILCGSEAE